MRKHRFTTLAALAAFAAACGPGEQPADYETTDRDVPPAEEEGRGTPGSVQLATATTEIGTYLTDAEGRALYLFTADERGSNESACYDECAAAWQPVTVENGEPDRPAPNLNPALIATIERRDGTRQLTYNGWPLYYYRLDASPGVTTGHAVHDAGGEWFLLAPDGEKLEAADES